MAQATSCRHGDRLWSTPVGIAWVGTSQPGTGALQQPWGQVRRYGLVFLTCTRAGKCRAPLSKL